VSEGTAPLASKPRLLIVDDDEDLRRQMRWALADEYEVLLAGDRLAAIDTVRAQRPAVVTLDLGLPPDAQGAAEGFATLLQIQQLEDPPKVVVITGREERDYALQAVSQGAYDYFCKPIQADELKVVLRRALYLQRLEQENRELQRRASRRGFEEMLGSSPPMEAVFAAVRKVAVTDAPVLVVGESGTGKELVARAIHRLGVRHKGPFVAINCGAIPDNLLESELFGHEKGAFTGAHMQRKGRIETAHGGTLFLDEIGDLPLPLQVKLLRFLQERRIERVGGRQEIPVDVRVLAATNADLRQAMREGRFREDLYYRIGVVVVSAPPLRDRGDDVLLLAAAFLQRYALESRKRTSGFSREALAALQAHQWPGNVRELENRVKRAVVMAETPRILPADLELDGVVAPESRPLRDVRADLERETVQRALARHKGNVTRAAAELGVSRPTLYGLIEKLGIPRD
jgi:two-component system, NtrC family, response regulator